MRLLLVEDDQSLNRSLAAQHAEQLRHHRRRTRQQLGRAVAVQEGFQSRKGLRLAAGETGIRHGGGVQQPAEQRAGSLVQVALRSRRQRRFIGGT